MTEAPPIAHPRWRRQELVLFSVIGAFVLFLIFFRLGDVPAGVFIDESSVAFNARCIDTDLRDQYGAFMPLFFRALDDYKSPLYVYAVSLTELPLGQSILAERLVSALYACGMALMLFVLLRSLTGMPILARWMALLSLLVPSLFFYARTGFSEASCFPFWLCVALVGIRHFQVDPSYRSGALAGASIGLLTYSYTTARLLAPLLLAGLVVCFYQDPKYRKMLGAVIAAATALWLPIGVFIFLHPGALGLRFEMVSAFRDHPSFVTSVQRVSATYLQHLASPDLFFRTGQTGEHSQWHGSGDGLLPLWLFAPLALGAVVLWSRRGDPFYRLLGVAWLISPIPASLTWDNSLPHTNRILHFALLAVVIGALAIAHWIETASPERGALVIMVCVALSEGALSARKYFTEYAISFENKGGYDLGKTDVLKLLFAMRNNSEEVFLPRIFFDMSPMERTIAFAGQLSCDDLRTRSLDELGIHNVDWLPPYAELSVQALTRDTKPPPSGSFVVGSGTQGSTPGLDQVGQTRRPNGSVLWSIYRVH